MGYTNYWYQTRAFTDKEWYEIKTYLLFRHNSFELDDLDKEIKISILDDNIIQFNSVMDYEINENLELKVGLNAKRLVSKSFAYTLDMLGGDYYVNGQRVEDAFLSGIECSKTLINKYFKQILI